MTVEAPAPAPELAAGSTNSRRLVDVIFRVRELSLLGVLAVLVIATTASNSRFLSSQNLRDIGLNVAIIALLAVGQTIVVVSRNIDLSVGSVLGFVAFMTGVLFADHNGISPVFVFAIGIAAGAGFGLVNGVLVSIGRVPSLVVTLGTLYIIRGLDFAWASGRQVNASQLPDGFLHIGSNSVLGIPVLPIIAVAVMLVAGYFMRSYRSGRELYAIGSNPEAAVLAGIRVPRRVVGAFVASGALAGLAGVLYTSRFGTVDAAAGTGIELQVVAAVVVGGVAIFGGAGTVYGAVLGALLLSAIGSALVLLKVSGFWEQAIDGALLLAAIALDRLLALRLASVLQRRSARRAG
ncbi:MAG: rhamnose transport system permease protein [Chloroflexota bacterium]|nr:rhamnose transport system permease protein [Chloroflexota bacterium]